MRKKQLLCERKWKRLLLSEDCADGLWHLPYLWSVESGQCISVLIQI